MRRLDKKVERCLLGRKVTYFTLELYIGVSQSFMGTSQSVSASDNWIANPTNMYNT